MPFIGNKPTAVPLTSSDLEDNIISTAKIQDNAVTAAKYIEPIPFRNIIINGDMSIAQRGTSASSITSPTYATVDRWRTVVTTLGTWTQTQATDVPSGQGFANSLKMDCTTADASPSASDKLYFLQRFEGQNLQYLEKGTSSAKSLTASFWVKSNKTGTYICELFDNDNSDRHINKSYTINSANTWEKKTITFAGDTTGTLDNDNNGSLFIHFWLGAGTDFTSGTLQTSWGASTNANRAVGQVNLADSTDNEWYITGVQLEVGSAASDFEFLPVDVNLQRCERYYQRIDSFYCMAFSTTQVQAFRALVPVMRASPTLSVTGAMTITDVFAVNKTQSSANISATSGTLKNIQVNMANFSSLTSTRIYFSTSASSSIIEASAEL